MGKQTDKLHIPINKELKLKLKAKARSLGIPLSNYIKLILTTSLKGKIEINP